jgi:hypothetical protein
MKTHEGDGMLVFHHYLTFGINMTADLSALRAGNLRPMENQWYKFLLRG